MKLEEAQASAESAQHADRYESQQEFVRDGNVVQFEVHPCQPFETGACCWLIGCQAQSVRRSCSFDSSQARSCLPEMAEMVRASSGNGIPIDSPGP